MERCILVGLGSLVERIPPSHPLGMYTVSPMMSRHTALPAIPCLCDRGRGIVSRILQDSPQHRASILDVCIKVAGILKCMTTAPWHYLLANRPDRGAIWCNLVIFRGFFSIIYACISFCMSCLRQSSLVSASVQRVARHCLPPASVNWYHRIYISFAESAFRAIHNHTELQRHWTNTIVNVPKSKVKCKKY